MKGLNCSSSRNKAEPLAQKDRVTGRIQWLGPNPRKEDRMWLTKLVDRMKSDLSCKAQHSPGKPAANGNGRPA